MATMDRMGRIEAIWKMLWSNKGFGQRGVLLRKFFGGSVFAIVFLFLVALWASAEDLAGVVKKAVEKSTLDQSGTRPFHLKAAYAPSFERDQGLNRVGEIEIWWQSPTQWRREVHRRSSIRMMETSSRSGCGSFPVKGHEWQGAFTAEVR